MTLKTRSAQAALMTAILGSFGPGIANAQDAPAAPVAATRSESPTLDDDK